VVQVDTTPTEAERDLLRQQVSDGKITGFLWLTDDALAKHSVTYSTKEAADFGQSVELRNAVRTAITKQHLTAKGMSGPEVESLLTPIDLKTVRIEKGREGASGTAVL